MSCRYDALIDETENFTYDFLDRLTGVSGPYTESYTYNEIGNIMSRNGISYTYGAKPHVVTSVGAADYAYDANGNMTTRGDQTITWDAENRPVSVSQNGTVIAESACDGDGNRVKKIENSETIFYINKYYEINLTTGNATSYYYHGRQLVAMKQGNELQYVLQDYLNSTSIMTDGLGVQIGATMKYLPFGETRTGSVPTNKLFTGQRLDATGLYYYNARYYDPQIGRFISPDKIIPDYKDPQALKERDITYCFFMDSGIELTELFQ